MNLGKAEASRQINVRDFKPLGKGLGLLKDGAENNAWKACDECSDESAAKTSGGEESQQCEERCVLKIDRSEDKM
jgi:hypothetical protein